MSQKPFLALLVLLCAVVPSLAQAQSDDVIRITTNLVQVDAVVTRKGKQVTDLKAEDFEIYEDGKLQTITSFAYVSYASTAANAPNNAGASTTPATSDKDPNTPVDPNAPPPTPTELQRRRMAFVIDDYGLSAQSMASVRRQLRKFIDEKVKPNDLIAIVLTSRARREKFQLTDDKNHLNQAWEKLEFNQCSRVGVKSMPRMGDAPPTPGGCGAGIGSFDDSISSMRAIVSALGQVPGRKSMVIFSNDTPLREEENFMRGGSVLSGDADSRKEDARSYTARLRRLGEIAIRSSVVIYGIDAAGLQTIGMSAADMIPSPNVSGSSGNSLITSQLRAQLKLISARRDGANKLAKATGGFLIHDQNDFQFDKILEDQSGYYLIGYRPSTETFDKEFHKIKARVKKPGHELRTRSGFFGITEDDAKKLKK